MVENLVDDNGNYFLLHCLHPICIKNILYNKYLIKYLLKYYNFNRKTEFKKNIGLKMGNKLKL